MTQPLHRWHFPEPIRPSEELRGAAERHDLPRYLTGLLARRGIDDAAALDAFLGPALAALHDPRRLPDAALLVARITRARDAREEVLVFGDFDADGLTGLAILVLALRRLGIDARPYVPSRLDEGHGLSLQAVETAATSGVTLIITVDTGSSSVAEVAAARERGIDVAITDHHRVPEPRPAAVALVNPHRPDATYPDRELSGAGVAFTVARLLLGELAGAETEALELADLATIGTVSDVAPILGENRAIARLGLQLMRTAPRPGIAALLARAGVARERADLETVGFAIAPRLNAAGRVGEALDAARLLLASTPEEATALATTLESANSTRRDLMKAALGEARALLGSPEVAGLGETPDAPAILVRGTWPVGIIGLVAGRLADETGRPAIVATEIGEQLRASCRGDGSLHLAETLAACGDLLVRHGGHAAAAGFELAVERWPAFVERFLALASVGAVADPRRPLRLDLVLPARYVDYPLLRGLERLAPYGTGNPEPLVAVLGLTVGRAREVNGGHTSLVLRRDRDVLDAIAFGRPDLAGSLAEGDRVDVVARVASRAFGGVEALQLEVRDVAPAGYHAEAVAVLERFAARAVGAGADRIPAPVAVGPGRSPVAAEPALAAEPAIAAEPAVAALAPAAGTVRP